MTKPFVHLHVLTEYSLLQSVARINELVQAAQVYGMPALAITDFGTLAGVVPFMLACQKAGIKPIVGCKLAVVSKESGAVLTGSSVDQLLLFARYQLGYQQLLALVTLAQSSNKASIPCVTKEQLAANTQ
ncbi:MAG: PHP domain-containing protein, partial [Alicyclobacillus shizuokensis]|nr:PHP domain-containing protein [Alicyclobacillus shizuokensis]